ncbi:MAG: hypothetical protein M0017_03875 [Desulfobacteraceae bacterium]|nr:hypothetical protein [Desulfobacteraceae bacterium]
MYGRKRTHKKHLKKQGWEIVEDRRTEAGYRLVLEKGGERVTVDAPSLARAYAKAGQQLKG